MIGLVRWVREGSIATVVSVAVLSAPINAHAGFFDDIGEVLSSAPELIGGLGKLMDPRHDIGKFVTGSVLLGGVGLGGLALAAMFTGVAATVITGGAAIAIVAGIGLMVWGGYNLWKSFNGSDSPGSGGRPARPPADGGDNRPGRIEPGRGNDTAPGSGVPGTGTSPGSISSGGNSSTPGTNVGRPNDTRGPELRPRAPTVGGADAAGIPR
jgi:hypothetical protein